MKPRHWPALFAVLLLALAACTAPGGPVLNPIGRSLSWFSYVGGEDVRARCGTDNRSQWRFVYNGQYAEQIRTYDLTDDIVGPGAIFQARVAGQANLSTINLMDPFGNWRGAVYQHLISPAERDGIARALDASGFAAPSPKGLRLNSTGFYWAVSACEKGQFHFYAWRYPEADLARLPFVKALLDIDHTDVAFRAPQPYNPPPADPTDDAGRRGAFQLTVGTNGLVLGPTL
jgi:hypothetical protein